MGWFEDLGNAVASGVAVVADTVETVVEPVTDTAENVVDAGTDAMGDSVDYVVDWLNINGGAIVGVSAGSSIACWAIPSPSRAARKSAPLYA